MIVALNSTSVSTDVFVADDSGLPVTGLVAATFPALTWSLAGANADNAWPVSPTNGFLFDLAALTTAFAQGGLKERGNGYYRLDLLNAMFTTAGEVTLRGEATGKHIVSGNRFDVGAQPANVQQIAGQTANAAGAVTFPASWTQPDNADIVTALSDLVTLLARTDPTGALMAIKAVTDQVQFDASHYVKSVAQNLPADYLTTTEAGQLTTAVADLVTLLSEGANIATIQTAVATVQTTLNAVKAKTDTLAINVAPNIFAPLQPDGTLQLVRGDDYTVSEHPIDPWIDPGWWPDLTGSTVTLNLSGGVAPLPVSVINPAGPNKQVQPAPGRAWTATLTALGYSYAVRAVLADGDEVTLAVGVVGVVGVP